MVRRSGPLSRRFLMVGVIVGCLLAGAALLLLPGERPLRALEPLGAHNRDLDGPREPAGGSPRGGVSDPALMLDLVAAMLDAGQPLLSALEVLADVVDPRTGSCLQRVRAALELGASWQAAWELAVARPEAASASRSLWLSSPAPKDAAACLRDALTFVATTGAPSAAVLMAEAAQLRRRRSREAERRAAALGVRLVVPLGLCALPAFVALTVVPLLLSLLPSLP